MKTINFPDLLSEIGRNLHVIRNARKETLQIVAKALGVTHPIISKIENGLYTSLQLSFLVKLCNYYNISLQQALGLEAANIFQLTQHNNDGSQKLIGQEISTGYELYVDQLHKEVAYLKEQNIKLIELMSNK